MTPGALIAAKASDGGVRTTFSCMDGEQDIDSLESNKTEASFGGDVRRLGGVLALWRDSSYLHTATLFLSTHAVHGC